MEDRCVLGLTSAQVQERVRSGLVNGTQKNIIKTKGQIIISHIVTYFNGLNLFLAGLIFFTGQFVNATFLLVVILNSTIGIIQELKVKKLIDNLSVMTASKARVIRDGVNREIAVEDIVKDDLLVFSGGDQISSDCIVLESDGMEVNESLLTGEAIPVKKKKGDKLFSGSFLSAGTGVGTVVHVGNENYAQSLALKAKTKKRASSEMQNTMNRIIKIVSIMIVPVGLLLFMSQRILGELPINTAIVKTVGGVIGMIPEGLVLLTSVSFVLGVGRLAKKRALVQEMEAIEGLARVDVLCLDKTGTITTGELKVEDVIPATEEKEAVLRQIMNELTFAFEDMNPTQDALTAYFENTKEWSIQKKIPFSSQRKYRAVAFEEKGIYLLGAPEYFLEDTEPFFHTVEQYVEKGMRVLLLAKCDSMDEESGTVTYKEPLGLIILSDVIRPQAEETFRYFADNKVEIKVISGDNPVTVSKIAEKAGVKGAESYIDMSRFTDPHQLEEVVDQYAVFGRVAPEQKQSIIKACQRKGHTVGMVGDGVNDVLAIKDADCGIAMASGSDAARQAAHIVLLDSDFSVMQRIVREGRTIIGSIERVSALYLTKTLYSVLLCVIFIFLSKAYPFIPIQLSLISVVSIGIPSFVLTLEQTEGVVKEGFLPHVMQISLPGALTMAVSMCIIQILNHFLQFSPEVLSAYNLLTGGAIAITILYRVCRPLNRLRTLLFFSMLFLFVLCTIVFRQFLGVAPLLQRAMLWVIPIVFGSMSAAQWLSHSVTNLYERRRKKEEK